MLQALPFPCVTDCRARTKPFVQPAPPELMPLGTQRVKSRGVVVTQLQRVALSVPPRLPLLLASAT